RAACRRRCRVRVRVRVRVREPADAGPRAAPGVALSRGLDFGTGGAGHVRLNIATSPEILTEGVRRMAAALR
ncbi:hypothetical protein AB0L81_41710, partial [Streptomyces sp. NPDC052127]